MPAGGIVANVQVTALDMRREAGERSVPHRDARARSSNRAFDAIGFFATRAAVDQNRSRQTAEQLFFERIGNALGWILPDSEADRSRDFRGIQAGANIRPRRRRPRMFPKPTAAPDSERGSSPSPPYERLSKK